MGMYQVPSTGALATVHTSEFEKLFLEVIRDTSGVPHEVVEEAEKKLLVMARECRRMYQPLSTFHSLIFLSC